MSIDDIVFELKARLSSLEDEKRVSACMNRYMRLCDDIAEGFEMADLMSLFAADAVWEGKGSRYAKTFGCYQGKNAIEKMFSKYTVAPSHFALNAHFLGNEVINVSGETAVGTWALIQPSDFNGGGSQLSAAKITAEFVKFEDSWLIKHFQTENIFSRKMKELWNQPSELPVPK